MQPVLQEVSHRVCCGLFKEYSDEWQQQQQQQQRHHRKELDLRSMNPFFLERSQVTRCTAACLHPPTRRPPHFPHRRRFVSPLTDG